MTLEMLTQQFTVCKVRTLPPELLEATFCFVGRTDRELSLVCETSVVPDDAIAREDGWRALRVTGTLDFSLVGILSKLSGILAEADVGIFAISTYDTDYILVKAQQLQRAAEALSDRGIGIQIPD